MQRFWGSTSACVCVCVCVCGCKIRFWWAFWVGVLVVEWCLPLLVDGMGIELTIGSFLGRTDVLADSYL